MDKSSSRIELFEPVYPRVSSPSLQESLLVTVLVTPLLLIWLFIVPSALAFLIAGGYEFPTVIFVVVVSVLVFSAVSRLTLTEKGIWVHRYVWFPTFIAWGEITSIEPVEAMEVVVYGWFWPPLPPREATISFSCSGHYRICTARGYRYFPPRNPERFEQIVRAFLPDSLEPIPLSPASHAPQSPVHTDDLPGDPSVGGVQ